MTPLLACHQRARRPRRLRHMTALVTMLTGTLVGLLSLAGCTSHTASPYEPLAEVNRNPAEADRLNAKAAAVMDSDPTEAEKLLREALTQDLYHGPAHNNLGVLYLKRNDLYSAASEFQWSRTLMPGHPDPRMNLALTLESAGRTDEAIATYKTALEVYPNHLQTTQALARIQVRAGKADAGTTALLEEIAMRGETQKWKEWARVRLAGALPSD